jgi:UDP-2,4-diacetamido-2,4,6-trideoxy-beta-L-altropyranose hydrolase
MKVGIRADGGYSIGMGHIMRTLVIAKELSKTNEVFYICADSNEYEKGINKILSEGFQIKFINQVSMKENMKIINADVLITDSYNVDEDYFNFTKKQFSKTVYIDDTNLFYFNVDIIINQNIGAENLDYKCNKDTKLLLGSKYAMLRNEFRNNYTIKLKKNVKEIMITLGGADPFNVTEKILSYVYDAKYNYHVVIGPSFQYTGFIQKYDNDNIIFYNNANMFDIMSKCDIAISACGSTLYEFCACGIPVIGILIAENQKLTTEKLEKIGAIKNIGWYNEFSKNILLNSISSMDKNLKLREKMRNVSLSIIDGVGVNRICSELLTFII